MQAWVVQGQSRDPEKHGQRARGKFPRLQTTKWVQGENVRSRGELEKLKKPWQGFRKGARGPQTHRNRGGQASEPAARGGHCRAGMRGQPWGQAALFRLFPCP